MDRASRGGLANPHFPAELPITPRIGEIVDLLRRHPVLIVAGETGSGKTTQLPKACLAAGLGTRGAIAHTQPRRLAARTVARRIADELGVELGREVGYAVRFSERTGSDTVVKVMTDGLLLNDIQRDRRLGRYDCVIVDEAHERSLNVDFILGYLRRLLDQRKDLKVVVTSATIDVDAFAKHFRQAPVVEVSGRGYPVETVYRPVEDAGRELVDCLREIADGAAAGGAGGDGGVPRDILVFQSGEREIFETSQLLRRELKDRFEIMPLYARLPAREQERVFAGAGRRQRVVLATNVAETSITVPNIGYVVDPGFARLSRYSYRAKLQQLPVEPISQASARQRAGRCGRIAPGVCYRLYSEEDFESRPEYTDPELTRTNLAAVVLTMRAFRLGKIESFPFIDPPSPRAVRDAVGLLHELQALENDKLTELGRTMARLPVDPRLGRMLIEASRIGSLAEVLIIVSALAAQDPRLRPLDRREAADKAHADFADKASDFLAFVNLWHWLDEAREAHSRASFQRLLEKRFLGPARVREWRSLHRQLVLACRGLGMRVNAKPADPADIHRALLTGSLGFIGHNDQPPASEGSRNGKARRRRETEYEGARGLKFHLFPGSALSRSPPNWVVAAEIAVTGRTFARCVAAVSPAWIEQAAAHLAKRSYSEPRWDRKRGEAMVQEQVTVYGLIVVGRRPKRAAAVDLEAAREIFVHEALVRGDRRLAAPFIARNMRLIHRFEELCAKGRRLDLMPSESTQEAFYLDQLPNDVCSVASFNAYAQAAPAQELAGFVMTESDLATGASAGFDERDFPTRLAIGDLEIPLAYKFAPGETDDGVSARVDLAMLAGLDQDALDWLVPGFFDQQCLALAKGLPKSLRRQLAPAKQSMQQVAAALQDPAVYRQGKLASALSTAVRAGHGVDVPAESWRVSDLPGYLRINVQVRDRRHRIVDQDRDIAALRSRLLVRIEKHLAHGLADSLEVVGAKTFPPRGVPESIVVGEAVDRAVVYPVLVDRGDSVDLRVHATPRGRSAINRDGYTRLALLLESGLARDLGREAERDPTLALHFTPLGNPADLTDTLVAATFWFVCFDDRELPTARDAFEQRVAVGKASAPVVFFELLEHARSILAKRLDVARAIDGLVSPAFRASRDDLARQLMHLVAPDFVRTTPRNRLPDLPRYLDGMANRIAALAGRVQRDIAGIEAVSPWEQRLASLREQTEDAESDVIVDLRYLIEEFRIATFCQHLGTREKVSVVRLARRFEAASALA